MSNKIKSAWQKVVDLQKKGSKLVFGGGIAMATGLIQLPTPDNLLATSTTWTVPLANAFFPVIGVIVGFAFGAMIVGLVIRTLLRAGKRVLGGGRRGGRRRRR